MESTQAVNRAKQWQVALFPFNNAATNVYFAFYTYFTYYAIMYLSGSTAAENVAREQGIEVKSIYG